MLRRFESRRWIRRARLSSDGRRRLIQLTAQGRRQFEELDSRQRDVVKQNLRRLDGPARRRLTAALEAAQDLLEAKERPAFEIRPFRVGDMGLDCLSPVDPVSRAVWLEQRYRSKRGRCHHQLSRNFKPDREQCWAAEVDGQMAGSIFLTEEGDSVSRLRLLYVEPRSRAAASAMRWFPLASLSLAPSGMPVSRSGPRRF